MEIDGYYFPGLRDLAINEVGDTGYGEWINFNEKGGEKEMSKTESLVSYLYQVGEYLRKGRQTLQTEPIREIVESLRRGAKDRGYREQAEMWRDLKSTIEAGNVYTLLPEGLSDKGIHISLIVNAFEKIEERHSKKPSEDHFKGEIAKLVKEMDKDVKELLKMLEEKMGD